MTNQNDDLEWLKIFPEYRKEIPKLLKIEYADLEKLKTKAGDKLKIVNQKWSPENRWFGIMQIKIFYIWDIMNIKKEITRLERLLRISEGKQINSSLSKEKALEFPIENIATRNNIRLRRSGKALIGLCPFHKEKTPSFYLYKNNNSFYCYGCNKSGNVITFVMLLYKFTYRGALELLNKLTY